METGRSMKTCLTGIDNDADGERDEDINNDTDADTFKNGVERFNGTLPNTKCAANTGLDNENPDPHPADLNDNRTPNTIDIGRFVPRLNAIGPGGAYSQRYDLSPDLRINTIDVGRFVPILNQVCS